MKKIFASVFAVLLLAKAARAPMIALNYDSNQEEDAQSWYKVPPSRCHSPRFGTIGAGRLETVMCSLYPTTTYLSIPVSRPVAATPVQEAYLETSSGYR